MKVIEFHADIAQAIHSPRGNLKEKIASEWDLENWVWLTGQGEHYIVVHVADLMYISRTDRQKYQTKNINYSVSSNKIEVKEFSNIYFPPFKSTSHSAPNCFYIIGTSGFRSIAFFPWHTPFDI